MVNSKFGVVIVAYNPNVGILCQTVNKCLSEGATVIIANNSEKKLQIKTDMNIKILNFGENLGIAKAQNKAISLLKKLNIEYVFFLDQDTKIPKNYFRKMLKKWDEINCFDNNLGAIGPNIYDRDILKKRNIPYVLNNKLIHSILKENEVRKDAMLISSGMLTKVDIFIKVGGNCDSFFIDWVDTKFILDLMSSGYHTYAIGNIILEHSVGKTSERNFLWKKIYPTNHAPEREFYFFRNAIWLLKNTKFNCVSKDIIRSIIVRFIYIFYEKEKLSEFKYMFKGLKTGIISKI